MVVNTHRSCASTFWFADYSRWKQLRSFYIHFILDLMPKFNKLFLIQIIFISVICTQLFILYKYSNYTHYDEWVGRGLYPGIAFAKGFDLYEPLTGPHATSYGWTSALFYSLSGFCNSPNLSISIAFWTNVIGFLTLITYLNSQFLSARNKYSYLLLFTFSITIFSLTLLDDVTISTAKIHSDVPSTIYLILGNILCALSLLKRKNVFLYFGTFLLVFSVMAKLPTLPGLFAPLFLYIISKEFKLVRLYLISLFSALLICLFVVHLLYDLSDYFYYHANQTNTWGWVDRHKLFDGKGAEILKMSYVEALPLLFRFLIMYIQEYWYFVIFNLFIIYSYFFSKNKDSLIFVLSISYFLTLASCLAALAHWGSMHNALFICNMTALIAISSYLFRLIFITKSQNSLLFTLFFSLTTALLSLPLARYAMKSPKIENSPYQQAYDYLSNGNQDIYFGWYPIPHALYDGSNYTSLEVPIWVGMARNFDFAFNKDHFPKGADVFATCHAGYGESALVPFLGDLEEIQTVPELSQWRLFKIDN